MTVPIQRPSLVLNRNWQPIHVATVARALVLLWNEHAKVVDPRDYQQYDWNDWTKIDPQDDDLVIRTMNHRIRVPEVVTLNRFDGMPSSAVTFSRRNVFKRDRMTCQYCGRQPGGEELTIDHVVPRSRGGKSTWDNCVLACVGCNASKADRSPEQAGMRLRKLPIQPKWRPLYAERAERLESWSKFVSDAYWRVEIQT